MTTEWFVYILKCADNTYYIGITNNLDKRIQTHNSGKGAKYTRARKPVRLVYHERLASRSDASKRESTLKKLNRVEKEKLFTIAALLPTPNQLALCRAS